MRTRYLLRFDDISPGMAWRKLIPLKSKLEELGVVSVLGVIPNSNDHNLMDEPKRGDFFDYVRHWAAYGDSIAQHGTFHVYDSRHSGLLGINRRSEFAGHPYDMQLERIGFGKDILVREGVWQPWFMAPAHSFDENTLDALSALGFRALTDGYGFFPYRLRSMILVPQLTSFPINVGFGYSTICVHINGLSESKISQLLGFIESNARVFVDFKDVVDTCCERSILSTATRLVSSSLLKGYRTVKRSATAD